MRKIKIGDIILLLLILAAGIFSIIKYSKPKNGKVIVKSKTTEYIYPLTKDGTYSIPGKLGNTTIQIKDSKVRIIDSPCPNKTCIAQGWGNPIICLPNQIFVSVSTETSYVNDLYDIYIEDSSNSNSFDGGLDAISK